MAYGNDPLYRMRHGLAGVGLALLLSVPVAALAGAALGDLLGGGGQENYGLRVALYGGLLLYVLVGAVVLFVRLARHETRPLSLQRVGLWLLSLWLWPALLLAGRRKAP